MPTVLSLRPRCTNSSPKFSNEKACQRWDHPNSCNVTSNLSKCIDNILAASAAFLVIYILSTWSFVKRKFQTHIGHDELQVISCFKLTLSCRRLVTCTVVTIARVIFGSFLPTYNHCLNFVFQSGEIFYLEDASVIQDIPDVVTIIQSIISQVCFKFFDQYLYNRLTVLSIVSLAILIFCLNITSDLNKMNDLGK